MADRALFVGFGEPVRGREERAVEVFNEWVGMLGRMQSEGRIEGMDVTLLDPHGGDLGGFFHIRGSAEQCATLMNDEEFRRAVVDASMIVDKFGVEGIPFTMLVSREGKVVALNVTGEALGEQLEKLLAEKPEKK